MDNLRWLPIVISAIALLVGILSLTISYASYRASGHRVKMVNHRLTIDDEGEWVEVRFANAGRSQVDLEAAWTNWYGSTLTDLPKTLLGGSSLHLTFGGVSGRQSSIGPLSVSVELGNGASFTRRVVLTEEEQGKLVKKRRASRLGESHMRTEDIRTRPPIRINFDEV